MRFLFLCICMFRLGSLVRPLQPSATVPHFLDILSIQRKDVYSNKTFLFLMDSFRVYTHIKILNSKFHYTLLSSHHSASIVIGSVCGGVNLHTKKQAWIMQIRIHIFWRELIGQTDSAIKLQIRSSNIFLFGFQTIIALRNVKNMIILF